MKALLIIDNMPSNCYECPLCYCDTDYDYVCSALTIKAKDDYSDDTNEIVNDEKWTDYRYSKCPLKPMQPMSEVETIRIHMNAIKENLCNQRRWNEAQEYQDIVDKLDEILGEEE